MGPTRDLRLDMRGNALMINNASIMAGVTATCSPLLHAPPLSPTLDREPGVITVVPDEEMCQKQERPDGVKGRAALDSPE
ncbi:hypothetical protein Pth03_44750 [Planotetraspora thailandica]|uniref:Uncharacterized protein n=1 Tax=Planotetraspora thailandica TaxID=487172 RepID=A0A8J3V6Z7_9ACTN|nr:hypothetical protein Pth03_44750 [Planotetraspora thailandica]